MSLISSASRSLENLVIGKVHGAGPVGVYSMAFQFARLPFMLVTGPLQYVLYPHVAAIREDRAKLDGSVCIADAGLGDGAIACGWPSGRGK